MNTSSSRLATILFGLFGLLGLTACDAQEKTSYAGDPIWSMKGSLQAKEGGVASDTQVAIRWSGQDVDVLEAVEVEGNFPAEFTLRSYEPPPAKALVELSPWETDARIGLGTILAVDGSAPLYPKLLVTGDLPMSFEVEPPETLVTDEQRPWMRGGVPAYVILYKEGDVPADLRCFADYEAGYNLVALREFTDAEGAAARACHQTAFDDTLAEYNAAHGTDYTEETLWHDEQADSEVDMAAGLLACQAGCELFKVHAERVDTDRRVTLVLEREVEFVDWN